MPREETTADWQDENRVLEHIIYHVIADKFKLGRKEALKAVIMSYEEKQQWLEDKLTELEPTSQVEQIPCQISNSV